MIASPGDDQNYGSSATKDCEALQLLSRRIHFGKFVAEAKFNDPKYRQKYIELIKRGDRDGIEELLTNRVVEEKLLRRLRRKAAVYGREIEDGDETPPYPPPSPKTGDTSIIPLVDKKISGLRLPVDVGKQKKGKDKLEFT